ncbi:MAG: acetyl-CoA C-acetyltransferase [Bacteroidota bacterium]
MNNLNRKVAIIGGQRIPFTKSFSQYMRISPQDLLIPVINAVAKKYGLEGKILGDVSLGATIKSPGDWNLAREAVLGSSLDPNTPAFGVQRACGTSLDTTNLIGMKIATGQIDIGIAGGCDTNSDLPIMVSQKLSWKLLDLNKAKTFGQRLKAISKFGPGDIKLVFPAVVEPRTKLSMGEHTELMVKNWSVSREEQDQLAYESHFKAVKAQEDGFYDDLITAFQGLSKDTIVRPGTTLEKLSTLKPAFDRSDKGTLTAGNSTVFTDGASAVLLASEDYANDNNLPIQAYLKDVQVAAVDYVKGEDLLIAPATAVANMLKKNGLTLQDFDFYEIHEAFAGQVLSTLKAWEDHEYCRTKLNWDEPLGSIDRQKLNVKGGSVAIGHPFAATGARIVAQAAKILNEAGTGKRALISVCTAGGMGVTAILEN